ncbi:hypothetical protein LF937_10565 [Pectobacterium versatile]|nr:hypothetical protein [Pectobacterium versatile]
MMTKGVDVAYLKSAPEDFKPPRSHKYAWLQKGCWLIGSCIKEHNGDYSFFAEYAEESTLCVVTDLNRPLCIAYNNTKGIYQSDDELLKRELEHVEDNTIHQMIFHELKNLAASK